MASTMKYEMSSYVGMVMWEWCCVITASSVYDVYFVARLLIFKLISIFTPVRQV